MALKLRDSFQLYTKKAIQWFPGHMGKGMRIMEQKLKSVNCIIEVHDSRIPFSGRNINLKYKIFKTKPHILVLNKKDLIERSQFKPIASAMKKYEDIDNVIFTNCKDQTCNGIRKIIPLAQELIFDSENLKYSEAKEEQSVMIIGVPNVGKSSLINILRNKYLKEKKAAQVGANAGVTRSVMNKIKISEDPLMYMIDTPGILQPQIDDDEVGMKLALCGSFKDHLVGEDLIADYLLYWLNKNNNFKYVELMGVENGPTDKIEKVLISGAIKMNKYRKIKNFEGRIVVMPDTQYSALFLVKNFRNGYFGKLNLDYHKVSSQ